MASLELDELIEALRAGRVTRRQFIETLTFAGLSGGLIASLLAACAPAPQAPAPAPAQPTRGRGRADLLKLLWWQGPTILNPHLAQGTKDYDATRPVYEPLAAVDADGNFVPVLAAEIPTYENGLLARDGKSVTWKLKQGIRWSDGQPFTAEDVKFTWEYVTDKDTAATTYDYFSMIADVQVIDQYTVKLIFEDVTPGWYVPFFGTAGRVIPKHIFQQYKGKGAGQASPNNRPVGTGPYKVVDFRPGDVVVYEINEYYREPDKPFFKRVELKGGGDAPSAARAALQTGEVDYAWNLQVEPQILDQLQQGGKGVVIIIPAGNVERILVNFTDPRKEVDGERSSLKAPHPWQTDLKVRQAYALLCNRKAVVDQLYPKGFEVAANLLVEPKTFRSPNTTWEFNVEKANRLLDEAGWTRGPDGVRQKGGVKMEVLYQTTVNAVRQKTQEIIKQAFEQAGIKMEIKAVQAAVFFSSDPANPDTAAKFYADLEMFTNGNDLPDPQAYMASWVSWQIAQKANEWRGNNYTRWSNPRYDDLYRQAQRELDARRRAQLFIEMNDLVVNNVVEIPLVHRKGVSGASRTLKGIKPTAWDSELWDIADWYREA